MISGVTFQHEHLLQSIRIFRRGYLLSRSGCCYESEDVQVPQTLVRGLKQKLLTMGYMDDWFILVSNRYKLREAVAKTIIVIAGLKLKKHLDKTFIGRLFCRLNTLGYQFSEKDLDEDFLQQYSTGRSTHYRAL